MSKNRIDGTQAKVVNFSMRMTKRGPLEEIKNLYQKKCDNFGCIHFPLINIDLDNVVPDEFYLFLRITDRLLGDIIDEFLERDSLTDFNKPKGSPKGVLLQQSVKDVNDLGITFSTWYKKY